MKSVFGLIIASFISGFNAKAFCQREFSIMGLDINSNLKNQQFLKIGKDKRNGHQQDFQKRIYSQASYSLARPFCFGLSAV